jgi:ligand-binding SRPBCC domain-containing protein
VTVRFECRTNLASSPAEAFDLARSIDAHVGSMDRFRERAIGGVTSGLICEGQEVTWRARHFGIPFRMTSRITAMEPPRSFRDEQVRGPFRFFRHEHRFEGGDGHTSMLDIVEFAAPFGPLGRLVERFILARYMRRLIEQRNAYLASTFL